MNDYLKYLTLIILMLILPWIYRLLVENAMLALPWFTRDSIYQIMIGLPLIGLFFFRVYKFYKLTE